MKKKINQIVFYFYAASFCILGIALLVFTTFFSKQDKQEQTQKLKTYVSSTQTQIEATINAMEYMHKILYPNALYVLKDGSESGKAEMLNNLFMCRDLNKEFFYSILFYPDESYKIITNDIEENVIPDICKAYKNSEKSKPYTTFFYSEGKNPNIIYIYNSQPVQYSSTSNVENYTMGISVLISKINVSEYSKYFAYNPSIEILLMSDGEEYVISKRKSERPVITEYECSIGNIADRDWRIHGSAAYNSNLFERQGLFQLFIIQAFLIIMSLLFIFQIIYKKYIIKPINQITNFLGGYVILKHSAEIPEQSSYEFDKIAQYISNMASKNRELVKQIFNNQQTIYEKEIENKSYRFYALKAQINPHFLYNTLDCISSLAYINDVEPIADITNILSKILRYTITEKPYTTVKDEVSLLENYFGIIKIRSPGRFNYRINVDIDLLDCKMLHMLLQPLAENSVKHNSLFAKKLIIYIKVYAHDNHLNFIIMDNGVGMSDEKISLMNKALYAPITTNVHGEPSSGHIGIHNINTRIKLMYGNEYGIQLAGRKNRYIKISVKIPIDGTIGNSAE